MKNVPAVVTVEIGDKKFEKPYTKIVMETVEDMLALLQDEKKAADVIRDYNYGSDLKIKAQVRNALINESAGPDKALEQMIKQIVKQRAAVGKAVTEEQAKAIAKQILGLDEPAA